VLFSAVLLRATVRRRACWFLAASALACLGLASPPVGADEAKEAAPAPAPDPGLEGIAAGDQAAEAFGRALQQHAAGDLEGARTSMLESYRLSHRAELLYNIARIEAALGKCPAALAAYRDYLQQVPEGRYRVEAREASEQLQAQCPPEAAPSSAALATLASESGAAPAAAVPATVEPQQARDSGVARAPTRPPSSAGRAATVRWIGWSAIAGGALATGGSVYFTLAAVDAHDRFQTNVDEALRGETPFDRHLGDEQHTNQTWAGILGVTGGVLVVGGTLALLFGPRWVEPAGTRIGLQLQPGSFAASYAATF